jgi:hypothetical protein
MPIQHVGLIIQLTYKGNETTSEHEIEAPTPEAAAEFLRRTMAKALAEELMSRPPPEGHTIEAVALHIINWDDAGEAQTLYRGDILSEL